MHDLTSIISLLPGQISEVRQLVGPPELVRRLEELGIRAGTMIEMVRTGSPCIVRVGTTKLCFRDAEKCSVLVAARMSA